MSSHGEWPTAKEIPCLFCGAKLKATRDPGCDVRNGKVLHTYHSPLCQCAGAKAARRVSRDFNRRLKGA